MDLTTIGLLTAGTILLYGDVFTKSKFGFRCNRFSNTSNLNPQNQTDGLKWSTTTTLKREYRKDDGIDEEDKSFLAGYFRYSPDMKKCKIPWWYRKYQENTAIYLNRDQLITSTLLYGGMKSSKTVFFLNILEHSHCYENAIVHDGTKLEMLAKSYNSIRDIIFNFYDDRATIHDILSEETAIRAFYFEQMLKSTAGKNEGGGFFTTGAAEHIENIALMTAKENFTCIKEKYAFFIVKLENLIIDSLQDQQKSEGDIISTLRQIMTPFLFLNFRIQDGADTFTINKFLDKNNAAKLFVSYPAKLKSKMQGLSAAFISMYTMVHLSRPDTTNKLYLYLIDELSSYLRVMGDDTETLKDQTELLRAKGGAFIGGLQGKDEDENISKILDKTMTQKIFFRTDGSDTKELLKTAVGKRTYSYKKYTMDVSKRLVTKSTSYFEEELEKDLILESDFSELGNKYEYIAKFKDEIFRGYVPIPETELKRISDEKKVIKKFENLKKKNKSKELLREEDEAIAATYKNIPYVPYSKMKQYEDYLAERYENYQIQRKNKNITNDIAKKALSS